MRLRARENTRESRCRCRTAGPHPGYRQWMSKRIRVGAGSGRRRHSARRRPSWVPDAVDCCGTCPSRGRGGPVASGKGRGCRRRERRCSLILQTAVCNTWPIEAVSYKERRSGTCLWMPARWAKCTDNAIAEVVGEGSWTQD